MVDFEVYKGDGEYDRDYVTISYGNVNSFYMFSMTTHDDLELMDPDSGIFESDTLKLEWSEDGHEMWVTITIYNTPFTNINGGTELKFSCAVDDTDGFKEYLQIWADTFK